MSEILLVGSHGAPGAPKDLPARQVRLSWYVAEGDNPTAVLLDSSAGVVDRYPGACPGVSADGAMWLVDLPALPASVAAVELAVTFRSAGHAGFEAIVGDRSLVHPGAAGQPGQERLMARLVRTATGWSLVPFDRPAESAPVVPPPVVTPSGPLGVVGEMTAPPVAAAPAWTGSTPTTAGVGASTSRTGRLVVVVDASGSMTSVLRSGSVATAVLEAVQGAGRGEVVLRAAGGVTGSTRLGATTVTADIGGFCDTVAAGARHSRSEVTSTLAATVTEPEDEVVVVSDAPPADLAAVRDALAGRAARWVVLGGTALTSFGPDRRRIEALSAAGVRVRTVTVD